MAVWNISRIFAGKNEKKMETVTTFNPTQMHLLRMFSLDKSEKTLNEVKTILSEYYYNEVDRLTDELWDTGVLDQKKLDELRGMHIRDILK